MSASLDNSTVVRPAVGHLASDLGSEVVLMSVASGEYYGLKDAGALVWAELKTGPRTIEILAKRITKEYAVDEATAAADLRSLLAQMLDHGLVEVVQP